MNSDFITTVGLEVHIQLNTLSKSFSDDQVLFDSLANENISATTLALPGTLPKANLFHIEKAVLLALAVDSNVNLDSKFDRKNYFYPDLPKGYQITQDKMPIATGGTISFYSEGIQNTIRIHHMHMEEDAGKSIHDIDDHHSLIDYNRAGTPLIELVTEPDFISGQQVHDFLAYMLRLVRYLGISDGNMEEGSLRCDCNVSVRPSSDSILGERCEIKNVNSKKFAKQAISFEAQRQIELIKAGKKIEKTSLLFDPNSGTTRPMRKKESENDYRYFPDPDLAPIHISQDWLNHISSTMPILPYQLFSKLVNAGITDKMADVITDRREIAEEAYDFAFEYPHLAKEFGDLLAMKIIPHLENEKSIFQCVLKENCITFLQLIVDEKVSKSAAYQYLLPEIINQHQPLNLVEIANVKNLVSTSNLSELNEAIDQVLVAFPDKVIEYKKGKKGLIGFFVGQVKQSLGQGVDAQSLIKLLEDKLHV